MGFTYTGVKDAYTKMGLENDVEALAKNIQKGQNAAKGKSLQDMSLINQALVPKYIKRLNPITNVEETVQNDEWNQSLQDPEGFIKSLDESSQRAYAARMNAFKSKQQQVRNATLDRRMRAGDYGDAFLADEGAGLGKKATGLNFLSRGLDFADNGLQTANKVANAGLDVEAQNRDARNRIIAGAQDTMNAMNTNNRSATAQMMSGAVQDQNAYDMGMQGIAMSGIEGSDNAERNLQFGRDMQDDAETAQFGMMNDNAQMQANQYVNQFSDLQQNKRDAMNQAYSAATNEHMDYITQMRRDAGEINAQMPNKQDYQALIKGLTKKPTEEEGGGNKPPPEVVKQTAPPSEEPKVTAQEPPPQKTYWTENQSRYSDIQGDLQKTEEGKALLAKAQNLNLTVEEADAIQDKINRLLKTGGTKRNLVNSSSSTGLFKSW